MFTTPLRSENMPPIPANTSGVEKTSIEAIRSGRKTVFRFATDDCIASAPSPAPSTPEATAPQPSLCWPRVIAQMPSATATTADDQRPDERARLNRRQREDAGEHAEQDPALADRPGSADLVDETSLEPPDVAHAVTGRRLSFLRAFQTERMRRSAPTKRTISPRIM